ncbi:hypothetical protein SBF1_190112 [Candidatus Desulfosporosinus infrequens]|uniref:Uncharacterized protein n=1 Tax=Candidatus Desulfosporosinus infrequens TaxID=2043169 RepID=A0A2U3KEW5_9FIRM|nr:hypothetical protein SBF1_190112 [Candidatus Desulfosporosinus infrequens]
MVRVRARSLLTCVGVTGNMRINLTKSLGEIAVMAENLVLHGELNS